MDFRVRSLLALIVFSIGASLASAQESATLEEIVSTQEKWQGQFATVRVRWREWHRVDVMQYHPTVPRDATLENTPVFSVEEFCWSDIGALSHESSHYKNGKPESRNVYGSDGKIGWDSDADQTEDLSRWAHVKILQPDSSHPLKSNLTINAINGLWNSSGDWWTTRIRATDHVPTVLSPEVIDEHKCAVVQLRWRDNGSDLEETFWFDPSFEYLPRKRQVHVKGTNGSYAYSYQQTWTADRFEEVSPGFHFPMHGFFHIDKIPLPGFEWLVEKVELNPALPSDQFQPRFSPGCRVTDYPGGRAYLADTNGLKTEPDPAAADPQVNSAVNSGPPAIALPPSTNWQKIIVACGFVLSAFLTLKWLRTGRSRADV